MVKYIGKKIRTEKRITVRGLAKMADTKIATQSHSFRCGLVAQQYKLFNKLNYIFNFTMEIFTYAI